MTTSVGAGWWVPLGHAVGAGGRGTWASTSHLLRKRNDQTPGRSLEAGWTGEGRAVRSPCPGKVCGLAQPRRCCPAPASSGQVLATQATAVKDQALPTREMKPKYTLLLRAGLCPGNDDSLRSPPGLTVGLAGLELEGLLAPRQSSIQVRGPGAGLLGQGQGRG